MKLQIMGLASADKMIEEQVMRLEKQVVAMMPGRQ